MVFLRGRITTRVISWHSGLEVVFRLLRMRILQVLLVLSEELGVDVLQPEGQVVLLVVGPATEPVAEQLHLREYISKSFNFLESFLTFSSFMVHIFSRTMDQFQVLAMNVLTVERRYGSDSDLYVS